MPLSSTVPWRPAKEETINDPTNPKHYWRFRMHVPLEDLAGDGEFLSGLQSMLSGDAPTPGWVWKCAHGRCPADVLAVPDAGFAARAWSSVINSLCDARGAASAGFQDGVPHE